jgi:hypothetical protein
MNGNSPHKKKTFANDFSKCGADWKTKTRRKPKPKKKGVESALSECSTSNHFVKPVTNRKFERWTKRLCSALSAISQNQGPRGLSLLSRWNDSFENGDGIGEICEACKVRKQVDAKQGSSGSSFL